jgi:ketosteroid isomerase-like protein
MVVLDRCTRWRAIPILVLIMLACSGVRSGAQRTAASDPARDIAAIGRVGAEFSQRYMRGDARGMAELYTENGMIFPGGRPIIRGRQAIEAYWTLAPGVKVVEHKTTADSIIVVGNTAYDYGTFRSRNSRDGQPGNPGYGKYVIVWQKQSNGAWLMHLDIWNGSPPPQP